MDIVAFKGDEIDASCLTDGLQVKDIDATFLCFGSVETGYTQNELLPRSRTKWFSMLAAQSVYPAGATI